MIFPSAALNERKKHPKPLTLKKSRKSIEISGVTGILSSVMLGAACQPMLPELRMLQELSTGAGAAYCHAQLIWWDLPVPEGLGVLSLPVSSRVLLSLPF